MPTSHLLDHQRPFHRTVAARLDPLTDPIRPARGDLLVGNRRSWLQVVMNLSGDLLSHSAVVGEVDGDLRTIELGPDGCFDRSIEEFRAAYRYTGLLRLGMGAACVARVADAAEAHRQRGELRYSWSACGLVEAVSLARRALPARAEHHVVSAGLGLATWLSKRSDPTLVTCSGFVQLCLEEACPECRPPLVWPARTRPVPFRGAPSATDVRPASHACLDESQRAAVRVLTMPSDLWVAPSQVRTIRHTDERETVLIDLGDEQAVAPRCQHRPQRVA